MLKDAVNKSEIQGLALDSRGLQQTASYDDRLSGPIWRKTWHPCANCKALIEIMGGSLANFDKSNGRQLNPHARLRRDGCLDTQRIRVRGTVPLDNRPLYGASYVDYIEGKPTSQAATIRKYVKKSHCHMDGFWGLRLKLATSGTRLYVLVMTSYFQLRLQTNGEVAVYKALGTIRTLKFLDLALNVSDPALYQEDASIDPSWDDFDNQYAEEDLGGINRSRNGSRLGGSSLVLYENKPTQSLFTSMEMRQW
ncbi:hypothetical protein CNMCM5793_005628 [Aspergillus hiratsukae]|uniref:Uncharacterized protein n=1 Tax=Aspergillus hiratsukae TaxID=1194566 RepID=A0A8H6QFE6_9EURO|nr:hypothetical protein CNMCM5793_005628 [Aspergillus hiratsukae]KAF7171968.1 hypothetical protein CNMCM6106_006274 [Aspergillus hiratsukae]